MHASKRRLEAQTLLSSSSWVRLYAFVVLFHCLLAYWEPSGNWNAHPRAAGWEVAAGCPRLYTPFAWNVSMIRSSVQPVGYGDLAPETRSRVVKLHTKAAW